MIDRTVVQNLLRNSTQLYVSSLSIQQPRHMIVDTIHAQYGGLPQSSFVYAKPNSSHRIDEMRMPVWLPAFKIPMF